MSQLSYEKCKELKEAGFPQLSENTLCQHPSPQNRDEEAYHILNTDSCEIVCVPTLSELIEACGDDFISLDKLEKDKWEATQKTWCCDEHGESRKYGYGQSPELAVANLWLELNKK